MLSFQDLPANCFQLVHRALPADARVAAHLRSVTVVLRLHRVAVVGLLHLVVVPSPLRRLEPLWHHAHAGLGLAAVRVRHAHIRFKHLLHAHHLDRRLRLSSLLGEACGSACVRLGVRAGDHSLVVGELAVELGAAGGRGGHAAKTVTVSHLFQIGGASALVHRVVLAGARVHLRAVRRVAVLSIGLPALPV